MQTFLKFILERNTTCFGQFLCPSSGVFHCTHGNGICHTDLQTAHEQDQDGTSWSCSLAVCKTVWHIPLPCVQWKTPDGGQRNCLKHVEFHSKNKFEKLVHLVGFIIKIYHNYLVHKFIIFSHLASSRRNEGELTHVLFITLLKQRFSPNWVLPLWNIIHSCTSSFPS